MFFQRPGIYLVREARTEICAQSSLVLCSRGAKDAANLAFSSLNLHSVPWPRIDLKGHQSQCTEPWLSQSLRLRKDRQKEEGGCGRSSCAVPQPGAYPECMWQSQCLGLITAHGGWAFTRHEGKVLVNSLQGLV